MSPWTLIGWAIVLFVAFVTLRWCWRTAVTSVRNLCHLARGIRSWWRTRATPPARGQRWTSADPGGPRVRVRYLDQSGAVGVDFTHQHESATLSVAPKRWQGFVDRWALHLEAP